MNPVETVSLISTLLYAHELEMLFYFHKLHAVLTHLYKTMPKNICDKVHLTLWDDLSAVLTPDRIKVRRHVVYQ